MSASGQDTAITTHNLTRRFAQSVAVDNLDLEIPKAQIYGFLGPNGSGKSTTFRMLCGLLTPSEGSVDVLGHSMPRDAERVRSLIGYMTQQFSLYRDLSVQENLDFLGRIQGLPRRARRERIADCLKTYDLERLRDRRPENLSGGERQRLALAGAVLHRPAILLLDEPTSAVDPQTRRAFWDNLFELTEQDVTILVSTHYMDEAERCHRLVILERGRLVAEGEPRALIENIGHAVFEIGGPNQRAIRLSVEALSITNSVAQLGNRLHVLIAAGCDNPEQILNDALRAADLDATVQETRPGLEDVFVAATGKG
jgi:ABC-2 type transport system ATP-binding protein